MRRLQRGDDALQLRGQGQGAGTKDEEKEDDALQLQGPGGRGQGAGVRKRATAACGVQGLMQCEAEKLTCTVNTVVMPSQRCATPREDAHGLTYR